MKKALFPMLASIFVVSCTSMTKSDHPGDHEIVLNWEFIGNNVTQGYYSSIFTLVNKSDYTLGNCGWALYYSQMGQGVIQESVTCEVYIEHINGDMVRITPKENFQLEPGQSVKISFNKPAHLRT